MFDFYTFFEIQPRLTWYYQQILKIAFIIDFVKKKNKSMIIWDADTVILKKINFFNENFSVRFGTTGEFYKAYYSTNKLILKKLPKYFISSLTQFISLTSSEAHFLFKIYAADSIFPCLTLIDLISNFFEPS